MLQRGEWILSTIDRVLQLAKEKGISQAFICGKLGLRRTYLSDVRLGKDSLPDDRLSIIADILSTTPEYLKGETDVKEKPPVGNEGNDEVERQLLEKMRSGKNQMFIIGHGAPIKMVELTDEEAAVMDATLQAMRAAKAKEEGKKE